MSNDKSDVKWTRISPVDTAMVFSKEEAYYQLGDWGIEFCSTEKINGDIYFVNKEREVIAVWKKKEDELNIYVWPKRQLYKDIGYIIFGVLCFVLLLIGIEVIDRIGFTTAWILNIVIFCLIGADGFLYKKFFKKKPT